MAINIAEQTGRRPEPSKGSHESSRDSRLKMLLRGEVRESDANKLQQQLLEHSPEIAAVGSVILFLLALSR